MKKNRSRKNKKLVKLIRWIIRFPGYWEKICDPDCDLDRETMGIIFKRLSNAGLYEVILFTLAVQKKRPYIKSLKEEVALDMLKNLVDEGNEDKIIKLMYKCLCE